MSGADHAVRDLNENSRCVYPLGEKAIRVCNQQNVVSLDRKLNADSSGVNTVVVYKHLWSLERILVGNSHKNSILNRKTPSNV